MNTLASFQGFVIFRAIEPYDQDTPLPYLFPLSSEDKPQIIKNWGDTKRAHYSRLVRGGTTVLCPAQLWNPSASHWWPLPLLTLGRLVCRMG